MNQARIGSIALAAATAVSQPLPPTVEDHDVLRQADLFWRPPGSEVWRTPAPHGFEWLIAYDPTPLTIDAGTLEIRLVNAGRAIRTSRPDEDAGVVTLSLSVSGEEDREMRLPPDAVRIDRSGADGGPIRRDQPVARAEINLSDHFGPLPPGVHLVRMRAELPVRVERDQDGRTIAEALNVELPPLRLEVIEHAPPTETEAGVHRIAIEPRTDADRLGGRIRGHLTNTLDVPLLLRIDGMFETPLRVTPDRPAYVYNAIEQWTESGWLDDHRVGYCGIGMTGIEIKPGETVPIALQSLHVNARPDGAYRCVVTAHTPDDEAVRFATGVIMVTSRP